LEERKTLWEGYDNSKEFHDWALTTLPKQPISLKRKRGSEDRERMAMLKKLEEKKQTMKEVRINFKVVTMFSYVIYIFKVFFIHPVFLVI